MLRLDGHGGAWKAWLANDEAGNGDKEMEQESVKHGEGGYDASSMGICAAAAIDDTFNERYNVITTLP